MIVDVLVKQSAFCRACTCSDGTEGPRTLQYANILDTKLNVSESPDQTAAQAKPADIA